MKIIAAGATGPIGGRLVPLLVERGHEAVRVARPRYGFWREGFREVR